MSDTIFTKVDYDIDSLVKYIELGEIALPDIQRPFVWGNAKVRDLLDSMYRGYPVGYLLFWQCDAGDRTIGVEEKQKPPRILIVDGQQRLTSLYSVIKGLSIVRENYQKERILIAFSPLEERFEVADAAIRRDKTFIPDIAQVWNKDTTLIKVAKNYLTQVSKDRIISDTEENFIENAIEKLHSITKFPLTALELTSDVSEEDIADVFVRINSKGTTLNQSDFILTLMSVFWDEGRDELERFCYDARTPNKDKPSPFNYIIEPDPHQLLRVNTLIGFRRARQRYVYSILRGKDLETGQFSVERRVEQFECLKESQKRTLNLQNWHGFLNCIKSAGFRSNKMISSENNLLFAYALYLIGRTEYKVDGYLLRRTIARWFYMSAVTGRFTGSPETAMDSDLANLRGLGRSDEFIAQLNKASDIALTDDFWKVTLPNDLATSSPKSPSLFAYNAALVLLDAPALFSNLKLVNLLDPSVQGNRSSIERHHLFPRGYLKTLNITSVREVNQIANYAFMEWPDNLQASDNAPSKYISSFKKRFSQTDLNDMYKYHALPEGWEYMEYTDFLESRREMMAMIIRDGYLTLVNSSGDQMEG